MKMGVLMKYCAALVAVVLSCASASADDWSEPLRRAELLLGSGDYVTAQAEYEAQARLGNGLAQFTLGLFYQLGWAGNISPAQSCGWFKLAAENQVPAAQEQLGYCYLADHFNSAQQALAYQWFDKAYRAGIHSAGCELGKLHIGGEYAASDHRKGVQLCQQAAMAGATAAQIQLGKWLLEGTVLEAEPRQALFWFEAAANNNSAEAAHYVARFYDTGTVVAKDPVKALIWYELAASRGHLDAYLPAAALHWAQYSAAADDTNKNLHTNAEHLAKAYVWATAASTLLPSEHIGNTEIAALLSHIKTVMPVSWQAELQARIDVHLNQFTQLANRR